MSYQIGDVVRLSAAFRVGSVETDPSSTMLQVELPGGERQAHAYGASAMVRAAAGRFYFDLLITTAGPHRYRWVGTGAAAAATPDRAFTVDTSRFA